MEVCLSYPLIWLLFAPSVALAQVPLFLLGRTIGLVAVFSLWLSPVCFGLKVFLLLRWLRCGLRILWLGICVFVIILMNLKFTGVFPIKNNVARSLLLNPISNGLSPHGISKVDTTVSFSITVLPKRLVNKEEILSPSSSTRFNKAKKNSCSSKFFLKYFIRKRTSFNNAWTALLKFESFGVCSIKAQKKHSQGQHSSWPSFNNACLD